MTPQAQKPEIFKIFWSFNKPDKNSVGALERRPRIRSRTRSIIINSANSFLIERRTGADITPLPLVLKNNKEGKMLLRKKQSNILVDIMFNKTQKILLTGIIIAGIILIISLLI